MPSSQRKVFSGYGHKAWRKFLDLLFQQVKVVTRGERYHFKPVPVGGNNFQGADPDGAGGTKYAESLHRFLWYLSGICRYGIRQYHFPANTNRA